MKASLVRRRPWAQAAAASFLAVLCALSLSLPQAAVANTHHYCDGCQIALGTYIQDPSAFSLTASYVHWLGTSGTRYLGVSASFDTYVHGGNNEVIIGYPAVYGKAEAYHLDVQSYVTVNAHADF